MIDLDTLISDVESGGPEREFRLLRDAVYLAWQRDWITQDQHSKAILWITDGAYLSAAEVLVLEGWDGKLFLSGAVELWVGAPDLGEVCGALRDGHMLRKPDRKVVGTNDYGNVALALTTAALRAHQARENAG